MTGLFKTIVSQITPLTWLVTIEVALLAGILFRSAMAERPHHRMLSLPFSLMAGYAWLVFQSLIFLRPDKAAGAYQLQPFWSYIRILQGNRYLLWENLLNIILFVPVGLLLKAAFPALKKRTVILTGAGMSVCLELLQLVMRRGLFEFDDMINNTLGAVIGCFAAALLLQVLTMDRKWKVLPALIMMLFIFMQSAMQGEASSAESSVLLRLLGLPVNDLTSLIIRKCAHFTEYAVLGMSLLAATDEWRGYSGGWPLLSDAWHGDGIAQSAFWAWLIGSFWAVTDEIHQHYVPERSCELRDVLIDSTGCLAGVMLMLGFFALLRYFRGRRR